MQKILRLNATTRANRHQMIEAAKNAIANSGGWILDFKLFSNISISLSFELPFAGIAEFGDKLSMTGLQLGDESLRAIEALAGRTDQAGDQDLAGTLQIIFIHDEPDLRISLPMIPG